MGGHCGLPSLRHVRGMERRQDGEALAMSDLIFIGLVVVFFVVSGLYVRFCERL